MPRALAVILLTIVGAISLIVVTGFTSAEIESTEATDKLVPIEKQAEQTALYREVFDRLATRHYRGQKIDDDLSQRYLAQFLDNLDPIKSYLLQDDIDEFMQWETRLDDLAKRGDVSPGYIMFNRLRERAISQLNANIELLQDLSLIHI